MHEESLDGLHLTDINPMRASEHGVPFTDHEWLYEVKYDGWRLLAEFSEGLVNLRTKNGARYTMAFPEIALALVQLPGGPNIIDGEACYLDENGVSNFDRFQDRARRKKWYEGCDLVTYCVFDLLMQDGENIMDRPLEERRQRLMTLLHGVEDTVRVVPALPADARLFEQAKQLKLEGFVAKRKASTYQQGPERSRDWLKIKRKGAVPAERFKR